MSFISKESLSLQLCGLISKLYSFHLLPLLHQIAACDRHCAALTTSGHLYLFGLSDHGQLGRGHILTNQLDNKPAVQVTQFLDTDERTQLGDVRIGYVCCGQSYTIAISESGSEVFGCGSSECGSFGSPLMSSDHHRPYVSPVHRALFFVRACLSSMDITTFVICIPG